ncbi:aminotransferase class V-fold PLP-dependent enzyme [Microbacterium horticulturae]|uniref:Aminotransferase class V-fold PLP-dependent enzyme n=1 Tax=Microbacterium horticulturae TaxID=3028316 RepID=A0ABY8BX30_9MICO|nr:aminotransferase class V-fold PLP-dependent enzyme [Microbacterium sp. KACC 23027]WEG07590.1 aminotransferase class V-fold PLP-dependent enzyme [Microbacterium sp. KACC 23027]
MSDLEAYISSFEAEPGYLDWAAFGPLSPRVRDEMHADAELLGTGRRSSIDLVRGHSDVARRLLAELLGADVAEVTLQPSTSYGLMQALYGLRGGVLVSRGEFPSLTVTATRAAAVRDDLRVQWMEPDGGFVTPDTVRSALTDETTAVAVSLVDFRTGYLADLGALRDVVGDRLLIVDAIQGFGVTDADYAAADVVCGNGYKWLRAGRGAGWARFTSRALERLEPVLSGFSGTEVDLPVDEVPNVAPTARRFTVTADDMLAAGRLATGLEEVRDAGVPAIADAVADRADEMIAYADEHGIPVVTPHERENRAGIVVLRPEAADVSALSAALVNRGVTFTARAGSVRLAAHAGTGDDSMRLLVEALGAFSTYRAR